MCISGKYTETKTLSSTDKKDLQDALLAYNVLKSGESFLTTGGHFLLVESYTKNTCSQNGNSHFLLDL